MRVSFPNPPIRLLVPNWWHRHFLSRRNISPPFPCSQWSLRFRWRQCFPHFRCSHKRICCPIRWLWRQHRVSCRINCSGSTTNCKNWSSSNRMSWGSYQSSSSYPATHICSPWCRWDSHLATWQQQRWVIWEPVANGDWISPAAMPCSRNSISMDLHWTRSRC